MTIKTIYSALISLAVLGLAACSTEVNNEQSQVITPETSSTRAFTLTPKEGPQTRTDVNISSRTKWTTHWKEGDELALFYPFRYNTKETPMGIVPLGLKENTILVNGKPITGHQNGTIANFKYFDYMWGKLKNIQTDGHSAWEDFLMDKQYCFIRLNIIFNGKPVKDMTQVTIKNIYTEGDFNLSTGQITYTNKGEMTVTADKPLEYFDIALLPDAHLR